MTIKIEEKKAEVDENGRRIYNQKVICNYYMMHSIKNVGGDHIDLKFFGSDLSFKIIFIQFY